MNTTHLDTNSLELGAVEVVCAARKLLKVDVGGDVHLARVDAEDIAAGLLTGQGELNLAIEATGAEKCAVENVNAVGRRNYLNEFVCARESTLCECERVRSLWCGGSGFVWVMCAHEV